MNRPFCTRGMLAVLTSAALGSGLAAPRIASAQDASPDSVPTHPPRDDRELWVALAGGSRNVGALGGTPGQRFAAVGFRVRKLIGRTTRTAFRYTIDFIPLAVTSKPIVYPNHSGPQACVEALCPEAGPLFGDGTAFGFGIAPLGGELLLGPRSNAQLSLGLAGGALLFDRAVPITSGTRFNFTAAANVELAFVSDRGRGVAFGYRFHHLSNAGLGNNPGLASHMFVAGLRWGR